MGGFGPTEKGAIWQRAGNRKHTGEGREDGLKQRVSQEGLWVGSQRRL